MRAKIKKVVAYLVAALSMRSTKRKNDVDKHMLKRLKNCFLHKNVSLRLYGNGSATAYSEPHDENGIKVVSIKHIIIKDVMCFKICLVSSVCHCVRITEFKPAGTCICEEISNEGTPTDRRLAFNLVLGQNQK